MADRQGQLHYRGYQSEVIALHEAAGRERDATISRIIELLRAGSSAILAAPPGAGKSHVSARIAGELRAGGRSVRVVRCIRSKTDQLAVLLGGRDQQAHDDEPRDDAHINDAPIDDAQRDDEVLIVDDAHLLGLPDIERLVDRCRDPHSSVLITIDSDLSQSDTPPDAERHRHFTDLWTGHGIERFDLGGVGFTEAAAIVSATKGAQNLDVVTRARIIAQSEGNPRLLRELALEESNGSTQSGKQSNLLLGPVTISRRLRDFASSRLRDLTPADEYALVTMARLGPLEYSRATRLVGHSSLLQLLRRGLVARDRRRTDRVTASHLYATAALASRFSDNSLETAHTAETRLVDDVRDGLAISSTECTLVAQSWIDDPTLDPLERLPADTAATILARAARYANEHGAPGSARLFAHRSLSYVPTALATEQLSRSTALQGDFDEALDQLERSPAPSDDPGHDTGYVSWWLLLLDRQGTSSSRRATMVSVVRSWGTQDTYLDERLSLAETTRTLMTANYRDGVASLEAMAWQPGWLPESQLRALTELLSFLAYVGETATFKRALEDGWAMVSPSLEPGPSRTRQDRHHVATEFAAHASIVRTATGLDRIGLAQDIEAFAFRAVDTDDEQSMALVNLCAGYLALEKDEAARAELELRRGLERMDATSHPTWTVWLQLLRANALAALGRKDEAQLVHRSIPVAARGGTPWLRYYSRHLSVRLRVDNPDVDAIMRTYEKMTVADGERSPLFITHALHGTMALGVPPDRVLHELERRAVFDEFPATVLLQQHIRVAAARDAHGLDEVGARLASLDFVWQAATAFREASRLHLDEGRTEHAEHSAARFKQLDSALTSPRPGFDDGPADGSALESLTRRELEIALLVAEGLSNSEIAVRLFLSVRTVESHVFQARMKTRAVRRSDLGAIVRQDLAKASR